MRYTLTAILLAALSLSACSRKPASQAAPIDQHAFDGGPIQEALQGFVDRGQIAGAEALVFQSGQEVYYGSFGYADREAQRPFTRDTLVQIFSMSKPITGVALMTLYEQGAFRMDDLLSKYLPEFANVMVYAGEDGQGKPILVAPERPITVRDITRHTAGFTYGWGDSPVGPLYAKVDPGNVGNTLTVMGEKLASLPLAYHPGDEWRYSFAADVQALLVEKLAGQPYEQYAREHVLEPLGMNETMFYVAPELRSRRAAEYALSEEGSLTRTPDEVAFGWSNAEWPMDPGGFGWTATIDDFAKFARMLLNAGELNGVRVLKPETVRLMASNHLDDSITNRYFLPTKGQVGFGIDLAVRLRPPANEEENPGEVGEFFWDGRDSTLFWVDPTNDLTAVLFVQLIPFDPIGLHRSFRRAVYDAIGGLSTER